MNHEASNIVHTNDDLVKMLELGYVPVGIESIKILRPSKGDVLIFKFAKAFPPKKVDRIMRGYGNGLAKLGLRVMFLPRDIEFSHALATPKEIEIVEEEVKHADQAGS